ncbi:Utp14-domain-containing protein [Dacryopinax primogenitus]|uniref:Utp14-domain-containing protein n=1 Tax=Dacryopinax primogenitus (strain DJM 731) TaxID=1858805 RepID=M5FUK2_DACPD|nr:Utp14-domain-containing protein [Dacryopinax primogenitus]EJT99923.1 Utp14-domain-containing protein [Dacryopinax primogenitus]
MAKGGRSTGRSLGHRPNTSKASDRRKFNAAGAVKRIASRGNKTSTLDVYEFAQAKNRRLSVRQELDRDEEELGRGEADDLDGVRLPPQFRMPADDEDGIVGSGDDEEIDSDEAFEGDSDEEGFANFNFSSNKKKVSAAKKAQPAQKVSKKASTAGPLINLDEDVDTFGGFGDEKDIDSGDDDEDDDQEEDDDDDMEGNDGDFMDLSRVLDDGHDGDKEDDKDEDGDEGPMSSHARTEESRVLLTQPGEDDERAEQEDDMEEDHEDDEGEEEEDRKDTAEDDDDDDDDEGDLAKLSSFIDSFSRKRKLDDDDVEHQPEARKAKRRILPETSQAGPENEFAVPSGVQQGRKKLQLQDLLAPLSQEAGAADLLSLQKSTKALTSDKAAAPLSAPLPLRAQEKLDRQAAYEATKTEVQKWAPTMRRIREAEHLSFPLQSEPVPRETNASLASSFKPSNEMESAVDRLLKAAELREEDVLKTEELGMAHLSKEEVLARRKELRQMRELMFRADLKAHRVAKIKSKAYHRLQKRREKKERQALEEAGLLPDGDDAGEDGQEKRRELERDRALERATQRHKNTGKWAKAMLARGEMDIDVRREMNEQLERSEQLRQKILGRCESEDESESEDDDNDDDDTIRRKAFDELAALETEDAAENTGNHKGIMSMKFMQHAAAEDAQRVRREQDDFVLELERMGADSGKLQQEEKDDDDERQAYVLVGGNKGRRVFGPGAVVQAPTSDALPGAVLDVTEAVALSLSDDEVVPDPRPTGSSANPWLAAGGPSKLTSKKNHALTKDSTAAEKSQAALKGVLAKTNASKKQREDEARVEISMNDLLQVDTGKETKAAAGQKKAKGKKAEKAKSTAQIATVDEAYKDEDSEDEANVKSTAAFTQRELVAQAFAGDNVIEEFEVAKKREVEADAPREEDVTLPGWGSWGGKGTRPPKRKVIKSIPGVLPTQREDAGKKNVIINEKRDKKGAKYQVKDLPWPYTSQGQFERMIEQPVGSEWNTRTTHQRLTVPKVVKKMGTVIDPVEKLF